MVYSQESSPLKYYSIREWAQKGTPIRIRDFYKAVYLAIILIAFCVPSE